MSTVVYYSIELARVTVGFDLKSKRTLIRRWSIAATGPADLSASGLAAEVQRMIVDALTEAAKQALQEAVACAYAAPGDLAARLAVAWQVFWNRFPLLLQSSGTAGAEAYLDQFQVGLAETADTEPGLFLEASAGDATVRMYAELYDRITAQLGGDAGKVANAYFGLLKQYNELLSIDIRIEAPKEVADVLAAAAEVAEVFDDLPMRIAEFSAEVSRLPDQLGQRIAAVALQVSDVSDAVRRQLEQAGIRIEISDIRFDKLHAGLPRLDFSGEFADALNRAGEELYKKAAEQIENGMRLVSDRLKNLTGDIEAAVAQGATHVVAELSRQFDALHSVLANDRIQVERISQTLIQQGFAPLALLADVANLENEANNLKNAIANAPQLALETAQRLAEDALKAAQKLVQDALEDAAQAVDDFFDHL